MFAIFLHESMNQFHQTATSFPTLVYTILLIICMAFWLIGLLGFGGFDTIDIDTEFDTEAGSPDGMAGFLLRYNLNHVPLTIILTLFALFGWILSFLIIVYLGPFIPTSILTFIFDIGVRLITAYLSLLLTSQAIRPIRMLFMTLNVDEKIHIIGQTAVVRSSHVTDSSGEALLNDGGAGILLNVRTASKNQTFSKGDEVVVIEKLNEKNLYRVISKYEFGN
jgi:hypothetical protein